MTTRNKKQIPPKSFEEALRELDQILSDIESGEVSLEENLVKYERGAFLIAHCRTILRQAEQQIETLGKATETAAQRDSAGEPLQPDES